MFSSLEHYSEATWTENLARSGFKRTDPAYDTKHGVIDGEYSYVVSDGHDENGEEKTINEPKIGLVIPQVWIPGDSTAKAEGNDEGGPVREPPHTQAWVCNEQGVFDVRSGQMDYICAPLEVKKRVVTNDSYYREIHFRSFTGENKVLQIPEGELHCTSQSLVKRLANYGLLIVLGKANQLREYLHASGTLEVAQGMEESGWQDDIGNGLIYLRPDGKVIMGSQPAGTINVVPASTFTATPLPSKGTLTSWQSQVALPACQITAGILALSAGFAPMLLKFGPEEINFLLNFHGKSTKGKSSLLRIATSIWGKHKQVSGSWNVTEKGLLDLAKKHRDRPMVLDELGAAKLSPDELSKMIYSLAEGVSRVRSSATGKTLGGEAFRCLVISSAEYALHAGMTVGSKQPNRGTFHRGIDIEIRDAAEELPEDERESYISGLHKATMKSYGTAAKTFLYRLVRKFPDTDQLEQHVQQEVERVMVDFGLPSSDPVISRGLRRFAFLAVAGELAVQLKVMPLPEGKTVRATLKHFAEEWYRKLSPATTQAMLIDRIANFILKSERRFQAIGKPIPAGRVGWVIEHKRTQQTFYAFTREGLQEAAQEQDVVGVAKDLMAHKLLTITEVGKYVSKIPVYTTGAYRPRAYLVKSEIRDYADNLM